MFYCKYVTVIVKTTIWILLKIVPTNVKLLSVYSVWCVSVINTLVGRYTEFRSDDVLVSYLMNYCNATRYQVLTRVFYKYLTVAVHILRDVINFVFSSFQFSRLIVSFDVELMLPYSKPSILK